MTLHRMSMDAAPRVSAPTLEPVRQVVRSASPWVLLRRAFASPGRFIDATGEIQPIPAEYARGAETWADYVRQYDRLWPVRAATFAAGGGVLAALSWIGGRF